MSDQSKDPPAADEPRGEGADQQPFDAIAAAAELDASLAAEPAEGKTPADRYIEMLEQELTAQNGLVERQAATLAAERARAEKALAAERARAEQALAEVERAKARLQREADRGLEQRRRELLTGFLEVLDDADRAVVAVSGADPKVREGVELLRRRLEATLQAQGVTRQVALGERFDPALHEAVSVVPVTEAEHDGLVRAIVRDGYGIGEEVLRPARVVVGKRG